MQTRSLSYTICQVTPSEGREGVSSLSKEVFTPHLDELHRKHPGNTYEIRVTDAFDNQEGLLEEVLDHMGARK